MKRKNPAGYEHLRILLFALSLLCFAGAPRVDAKIVFCIAGDIYVINDDGSGIHTLTTNTRTKDIVPRWSPDGKRIAFTRFMDKEQIQTSGELFIMNADGTEMRRLTHNNFADGNPCWSPDGKRIAFVSLRGGQGEVYVMDLASETIQRLTEDEGELGSTTPDWSPDGTEIVYEKFISNGPGFAHKNLYLMSANGLNHRPLFPDPEKGAAIITMRFYPRWSKDGTRILFNDCPMRADGQKCIPTIKRIGGLRQEITAIKERLGDNTAASAPCWMDSDRAILFSLKLKDAPNPNYDLYRYVLGSGSLRRLTRSAGSERFPDWVEGSLSVSPQGKLPTRWGEIKHSLVGSSIIGIEESPRFSHLFARDVVVSYHSR